MNVNKVGKGLVLGFTAASMVALAWAIGVYFQFTDWGWKEPRKDIDMRIASEFDKRVAALNDATSALESVLPAATTAQTSLREAEDAFRANNLYYRSDLQNLRSGQKDLEIKSVTFKEGKLALEKGKATGRPVLGDKVGEISKSYKSYENEWKEKQVQIAKLTT